MKMEVVKDFENKLIGRHEVVLRRDGEEGNTPSRAKIKQEVAKQFKVEENLVVVKRILTHFGAASVEIEANIYDDENVLKRVENEYMIKRNSPPVKEGEEGEK